MASTNQAAQAAKRPLDYSTEIRFGVVLYGGVSLAVYINGVAAEMYEMVAATPKPRAAAPPHDGANPPWEPDTREVYRRLAWLVDNQDVREKYFRAIMDRQPGHNLLEPRDVWDESWCADRIPARLTVDVISGTSAGGINGIFLAKALTNGESLAPLADLWVQEGDIARLLNDRLSYADLIYDRKPVAIGAPPRSLLNSDRMFLKLFDAIKKINPQGRVGDALPDGALVNELDLFITTTDIAGSPVPLRLSGQVVYEKRHKQNFHFAYSHSMELEQGEYRKQVNRNDFEPANDILLAFAARCTSAFPFAFEPMTMDAARQLASGAFTSSVRDKWHKYLSYIPPKDVDADTHVKRAYGDGGYLDNKPFTYVANTLATRQALVPVERKLIYVEPAPNDLDAENAASNDNPPDALNNALAALTSIPRYETILEDLQDVLKRNRSIERVDRIVREGEKDLHEMLEGDANPFVRILKESPTGQIPPWPDFHREKMAAYYGTAFLAYRRMRVSSVTDQLAHALAKAYCIDVKSDHLYALTALLRTWRDLHYWEPSKETEKKRERTINAFLDKFDIDYRIRKLSFLLRQIDHMMRLMRRRRTGVLNRFEYTDLSEEEKRIRERLEEEGLWLDDPHLEMAEVDRSIDALHMLKERINEAQGILRMVELDRESEFRKLRAGDELVQKLNPILSLLLGEPGSESVTLATASGKVEIGLPGDTIKSCAAARTLQESVLRRARALLGDEKKTALHALLDHRINLLSLTKMKRTAWDVLGKPQLILSGGKPPTGIYVDLSALREKKPVQGTPAEYQKTGTKTTEKKVKVQVNFTGDDALDTDEGIRLRRLLGEYYIYFDLFDQMSFPLYHDTGIGEPATVEVVRISPRDATNLIDEKTDKRRKLAGTALANFGAFIDERWRRNDVMWGRLDGAERLIDILLPMKDRQTQAICAELKDRAHRAILRETLLSDGAGKVADLVCSAVAEISARRERMQRGREPAQPIAGYRYDPVQLVRYLLKRISPVNSRQDEHLAAMLASCLNGQGLLEYVRKARDIDRNTDPHNTLDSASRAVTIAGRMLEEISNEHETKSMAFRWLTRFGLACQGLMAVALPGSLAGRWWRQFKTVVYILELFIVAGAFLLFESGVLEFGLKLFGLTIAVHLLVIVMRDVITARNGWLLKGGASGALIILLFSGMASTLIKTKIYEPANSWLVSLTRGETKRIEAPTEPLRWEVVSQR